MAGFGINELRAQLTGGGARQALFQVHITNPIFPAADFKAPFMVKAASMPSSQTGKIEVPWMGRKINYYGDRIFEDWTVTVINDEDFAVRNAMEAWSNAGNSHIGNTRAMPNQYKSQAQVWQYSKTGVVIREVTLSGIFPINISAMDTDWNATDTIQEFQVTFAVDYWDVTGGITGVSTS